MSIEIDKYYMQVVLCKVERQVVTFPSSSKAIFVTAWPVKNDEINPSICRGQS